MEIYFFMILKAGSPYGAERPEVSYKGTNPTIGPHTFMTSSKPNLPPKVPSPNTLTLGVRASTCGFWEDTIQFGSCQTAETSTLYSPYESGTTKNSLFLTIILFIEG